MIDYQEYKFIVKSSPKDWDPNSNAYFMNLDEGNKTFTLEHILEYGEEDISFSVRLKHINKVRVFAHASNKTGFSSTAFFCNDMYYHAPYYFLFFILFFTEVDLKGVDLSDKNPLKVVHGLTRSSNIDTFIAFARRVSEKPYPVKPDGKDYKRLSKHEFFTLHNNFFSNLNSQCKLQALNELRDLAPGFTLWVSGITGACSLVIIAIQKMNIVYKSSFIYNIYFLYSLIGIFALSSLIVGKKSYDLCNKVKSCDLPSLAASPVSSTVKLLFGSSFKNQIDDFKLMSFS